ncbi:hypothetical protein [Clostridium sporogenes]|uniref:hypothetical protein n=1 Tax=Clostridium sporogenes TaxID=1509 RepID=UPI0013D807CB|nr:hypothetical protein [Clostridium sporogenes]
MECIKTTISREKLYNRNFTRDSLEKIKIKDKDVVKVDKHKALIDIFTLKYIEDNSI